PIAEGPFAPGLSADLEKEGRFFRRCLARWRTGVARYLFASQGDDDHAIERVSELASSIGLHPIQTGPLKNSRYLEAMAHLNIAIAVGQGGGTNAAFIYHSA
ncbi:MAG: hypothetical protein AAGE89_14250, partial [Pseudomonadota bacterium]